MLSTVVELLLYNMFALSGITFIWLAIIEKMLFKKEKYNTQLTKLNDIEQRNVWKTNIIFLTYNRRFLKLYCIFKWFQCYILLSVAMYFYFKKKYVSCLFLGQHADNETVLQMASFIHDRLYCYDEVMYYAF